jgi:hypothetical protein
MTPTDIAIRNAGAEAYRVHSVTAFGSLRPECGLYMFYI